MGTSKPMWGLQTYRCIQGYGRCPYIQGCPNIKGSIQTYGVVQTNRGHPNIWGKSKHMGHPNIWGVQTYRGIQTYRGCSNIHVGIHICGGCPNIQGAYTSVPTEHKESMFCQTNGVSICPHTFGCPPYVWMPPMCLDAPKCMGTCKCMGASKHMGV